MKHVLSACTAQEIGGLLNVKPFQGRQIFRWIHQKCIFDFNRMTDLPLALRERLLNECTAMEILPIALRESKATGTKKVLYQMADGDTVESVLLRDQERITLCLSSQAGCALKCAFCATGQAGFRRHLDVHEIVEQALYLLANENLEGRTPNIVYMGMGEPFRNYDAVMHSIRLLMEKDGLAIGARKITVSTAGEAPQIERFAEEDWQVRLSVSLHAANNVLRSTLVPINRKYPLERLRQALESYISKTKRQITFEWTLLDGVNDRPEDVKELLEYAQGLKAFVNIIPWNPVPEVPFKPSPKKRCEAFRDALIAGGLQTSLRQEKGQDIEAACGQLRRIHQTR